MKNFIVAAVALTSVALSVPANAADLPVKARPYSTPVPFDWTGFYIGGHFGGGWGTKKWVDAVDGTVDASHDVSGILGGIQGGFNWQTGWLVLGVEGDYSWADLTGSGGCNFDTPQGPCSSKVKSISTVTGRAGVTWERALLYAKGGAAWARDSYSVGSLNATASNTATGWVVGAGIEYAFDHNWSGKIEYNYMDFGTDRLTFVGDAITFDDNVTQRIQSLKVGVNYKFGPLTARY